MPGMGFEKKIKAEFRLSPYVTGWVKKEAKRLSVSESYIVETAIKAEQNIRLKKIQKNASTQTLFNELLRATTYSQRKKIEATIAQKQSGINSEYNQKCDTLQDIHPNDQIEWFETVFFFSGAKPQFDGYRALRGKVLEIMYDETQNPVAAVIKISSASGKKPKNYFYQKPYKITGKKMFAIACWKRG